MKSLLLSFTACLLFSINSHSQNFINHKGNDLFLSGINLAWMEFGNDLTNFNKDKFTSIMKDVSSAGGNSVRWWIHIDGKSTPTFANDTVTGITPLALDNLATALDIAAENGIVVSLCLWSFDMMVKKKTDESDAQYLARVTKNRRLLEDSAATQAYIKYALTPMVNKVKGHTAILCWEIFNEPEGMTSLANWSNTDKVSILNVQKFVNRCAGEIHRLDPSAKVSNGSWNALATIDISAINSTNYYSDDALITAGGDQDGTLDFYMFHYYPQHFGNKYSPFHNPIAYWELDKPLIIGEYPAKGIIKDDLTTFYASPELDATQSLAYLYDNGYAGGWGWTYTGHDGNGSLKDMRYVMDSLKKVHPEHIIIPRDPNHNYAPTAITNIPDTLFYINSADAVEYVNLNSYFTDEEQLTYTISTTGPVSAELVKDSLLTLKIAPDSVGISLFTITATDNGGKKTSSQCSFVVFDHSIISDNKLLHAFVTTSTEENSIRRRPYLNDGNDTTRWSSTYANSQWIQFDMQKQETISRIKILWEAAYGDAYEIEVSTDNQTWTQVFDVKTGQKPLSNIVFSPIDCRYIRINLIKRATGWGYSIFEIEAYESNNQTNNVAPTASATIQTLSIKPDYNLTYTIPRTKFIDANGDVLQFTASLANGDALPSWLEFTPNTLELKGYSQLKDTGTYTIQIKGTDWFQQQAIYTISLIVKNPTTELSNIETSTCTIFPNPLVSNSCNITLANNITGIANIQIASSLGAIIESKKMDFSNGNGVLELKNTNPGIYFITIVIKNKMYRQTLTIK